MPLELIADKLQHQTPKFSLKEYWVDINNNIYLLYLILSRINKADVEVQTTDLVDGVKLTFMKLIFVSPALEIKAPVINDKIVGLKVHTLQLS